MKKQTVPKPKILNLRTGPSDVPNIVSTQFVLDGQQNKVSDKDTESVENVRNGSKATVKFLENAGGGWWLRFEAFAEFILTDGLCCKCHKGNAVLQGKSTETPSVSGDKR